MGANPYLWPKSSKLSFYNGWGKCLFTSTNRRLDLSDTLMMYWEKRTRTIYLGISLNSVRYSEILAEDEIQSIENLIRYDLGFEEYRVQITRLNKPKWHTSNLEYIWKLVIYNKFLLTT